MKSRILVIFLGLTILSCKQGKPQQESPEVIASPPEYMQDWEIFFRCEDGEISARCPSRSREWKFYMCPYEPVFDDWYRTCGGYFENSGNIRIQSCGQTPGSTDRESLETWGIFHVDLLSDVPWMNLLNTEKSREDYGRIAIAVADSARWPNTPNFDRLLSETDDAYFDFYEISPPNQLAHFVGSVAYDPEDPNIEYLTNRRDHTGQQLEVVTLDGYRIDFSCIGTGIFGGRSNKGGPGCGLESRAAVGDLYSPDGEVSPIMAEFLPPDPSRRKQPSVVFPMCPACEPLDENGEISVYNYGYFPLKLISAATFSSPTTLGSTSIDSLGLLGLRESRESRVFCYESEDNAPWQAGLFDWKCDSGPFALLVGKWMAPFCEGWGLPRGIMVHRVRLSDGAAQLVDWHPLIKEVWEMPWNTEGLSNTVGGKKITVGSQMPDTCGISIGDAITIEHDDGTVIKAALPLKVADGNYRRLR